MRLIILIILLASLTNAININEIMYNPSGIDTDLEYIEIYNPENELLDLEDLWMISDDKSAQRIQDYSGWVTETNKTYLIVTSCYTDYYDQFDDIEVILNPISMTEYDEYGEPVCDIIGNNLKNSNDYIELWHCLTSWEGEECTLVDFVEYNDSMGADGNGKSLQLVNHSWIQKDPTPAKSNYQKKENTKIKVNIDEFLLNTQEYDKLFKIQISDKDCRTKENVTVEYDVTDEFMDTIIQDDFTVEVGCSKIANTGELYIDTPGAYRLCGHVKDKNEVIDCLNFKVIDTMSIEDDIEINILPTNMSYTYPDSILFEPILSDETYPYKIAYWFEDKNGTILKKKTITQNTNKKSFKPSINEIAQNITIRANLEYIGCTDTNTSNNNASLDITYYCSPISNELELELTKDKVIMNYPYSSIFKVSNNGYTPCMLSSINSIIKYNITKSSNSKYTYNITNLKKTKSFGAYKFNKSGTYEICAQIFFNDTNLSNNKFCKNITSIDTSNIPCNVSLNISAETNLQNSGTSIKFRNNLNNKSYPYAITYWIEDLFGNIVKEKIETTNTNQKSFTKSISEIDRVFLIKSNLTFLACNDSNPTDNFAQNYIMVKGQEALSENKNANITIQKVYSENNIEWGDVFKVRLSIYKNNTAKTKIDAYVINSAKTKVTEKTTGFNLNTRNINYDLTIPIALKQNCDKSYADDKYTLVLDGIGINATYPINISGESSSCKVSCNDDSSKKSSFEYYLDQAPHIANVGDDLVVKVKLDNEFDSDLDIEAYAYVYRGSKSYSGTREQNLQEITIGPRSDLTLGLIVNLDDDIPPGDYKIKVKLRIDGQKTYKELTKSIEIINDDAKIEDSSLEIISIDKGKISADISGNGEYQITLNSFLQEKKLTKFINDKSTITFDVKLFSGKNVYFIILSKNDQILDIRQLEHEVQVKTADIIEKSTVVKNQITTNAILSEPTKIIYKSTSAQSKDLVPHFFMISICTLGVILIINAKRL